MGRWEVKQMVGVDFWAGLDGIVSSFPFYSFLFFSFDDADTNHDFIIIKKRYTYIDL